jgi:flagellar biosynthesis chaperone FliJ
LLSVAGQLIPDLYPVEIELTPQVTTRDIISIIQTQTALMNKLKIHIGPVKRVILVFSSVERANPHVLEFLRQLLATSTIQVTSEIDPKFLNSVRLGEFLVVIKANQITGLPNRFLSLFTIIRLPEYSKMMCSYISGKVGAAFGVNPDMTVIIAAIGDLLKLKLSITLRLLLAVAHIPQRAGGSEEEQLVVLQSLLSAVRFSHFQQNSDDFAQFLLDVDPILKEHNYGTAFEAFKMKPIFGGLKYEFQGEHLGSFTCNFVHLNDEAILAKLKEKLKTDVSEHTRSNFMFLAEALLRPGNHCVLSSISGTSRIDLCRLFAEIFEYNFVDLTRRGDDVLKLTKEAIIECIQTDSVQIIVARIGDDSRPLFDLLASAVAQCNLFHLLSVADIDKLIQKKSTLDYISPHERQIWIQRFRFIVKCKCRLAISIDCELQETAKFGFTFIEITPSSRERICHNLLPKHPESVTNLLVEVSQIVKDLIPVDNLNQFYDFVHLFAQLLGTEDFRVPHDKSLVVDFLDRLTTELGVFSDSIATMEPQLAQLVSDIETKRTVLSEAQEVLNHARSELNEQLEALEQAVTENESALRDAEEDLSHYQKQYTEAAAEVAKLKEQDVLPIRIQNENETPVPSVRLMVELLCLLLDRGTSFTSSGFPFLQSPEFLETLQTLAPDGIPKEILSQANSRLLQEPLHLKQLESVAPILVTLQKWVQQLCLTAEGMHNVKDITVNLTGAMSAVNEFRESTAGKFQELEVDATNCQKEEAVIEAMAAEQVTLSERYELIKSQKETLLAILANLDTLMEQWRISVREFPPGGDASFGDCLLYSFYLSYCGMCDYPIRTEIMTRIQQLLKERSFAISSPLLLEAVSSRLFEKQSPSIGSIDPPIDIVIDIHHIFHSPRPALVIDPEGILVEILLASPKTFIVSINSFMFEQNIAESLKAGYFVIVMDVDGFSERVGQLLTLLSQPRTGAIRLAGNSFLLSPNFRCMLVTNHSEVTQIPIALLTRVTVVNVTSSTAAFVQTSITRAFVSHFDTRHVPTMLDIQRGDMARVIGLHQTENVILKLLTHMARSRQTSESYSYFNDPDTVNALVSAKTQYMEHVDRISSTKKEREEIQTALGALTPLIKTVTVFWTCLVHEMPNVANHYRYQFLPFTKALSTFFHTLTNMRTTNFTDEQIQTIHKQMISAIVSYLGSSFFLQDLVFFLFVAALSLRGLRKELPAISSNLAAKFQMSAYDETDQSGRSVVQRLKNAGISEFFNLVRSFTHDAFGDEFEREMTFFQSDSLLSPTAQLPTTLISSPANDPTPLILAFVASRSRQDQFDCISLCPDSRILADNRLKILDAMGKGTWMLIQYSQPCERSAQFLNEICFLLAASPVHSTFRLIINCQTTAFISPHFFLRTRRFAVEQFPSVRLSVRSFFHHYSSLLRVTVNQRYLKRLFFLTAVAHSVLAFRAFVEPLGMNLWCGQSSTAFTGFLAYARENLADFKPKRFREFFHEIAFASCAVESQDRRKLRAIAATLFPDHVLDADVSFLPSDSPGAEAWTPPLDGTLTQMLQGISESSLFAPADFTLATGSVGGRILSWSLSRWLAAPFLAIHSRPQWTTAQVHRKFADVLAGVPALIVSVSSDIQILPMIKFWFSEIDFYNSVITVITKGLGNCDPDIVDEVMCGRVPKKWEFAARFVCFTDLNPFILFFCGRRRFLVERLGNPTVDALNIVLIDNVRGFFAAHLHDIAIRHGRDSGALYYDFLPDENPQGDDVTLTNLWLMNANWMKGKLVLLKDQKTHLFTPFPPICCRLTERSPVYGDKAFICPLYKAVFLKDRISPDLVAMHDGETDNFVLNVVLPTDVSDRCWLLNNVGLYCQVPANLL